MSDKAALAGDGPVTALTATQKVPLGKGRKTLATHLQIKVKVKLLLQSYLRRTP